MNDRNGTIQIPGFRQVPRTGVINVMYRASELGYNSSDDEWANLGQGAPDTGHIEGVEQCVNHIELKPDIQEYSPIAGIQSLRKKIAEYYNHFFRKSKKSKYTFRNVCITPGGRSALTRIAACLGNVNIGHFIPHGKFVLNFNNLKFCSYFESFSSSQIQLWYFYSTASSFEQQF